MSAKMLPVFTNKEGKTLVQNPKSGTQGWQEQLESDKRREVIFSSLVSPIGWIPLELHRKVKDEGKQKRKESYKLNPNLLQEKIQAKKRRNRHHIQLRII